MIKRLLSISILSASFSTAIADDAVLERGKKLYDTPGLCTTCHQPTGAGVPGAFPPLAGSEWVTGPKENLVNIIKYGLVGEIEVAGVKYNGVMTPALNLGKPVSNEEIADVITYIRHQYGNGASAMTAEEVTTILAESDPVSGMFQSANLLDPNTPDADDAPEAEIEPLDTTIQNVKPEKVGVTTIGLLLASLWACLSIFPGITGLGRG